MRARRRPVRKGRALMRTPRQNGINKRKIAFEMALRKMPAPRLARARGTICAIRPSLYNAGVPTPNQIIQGDSIQILNDGPEGWVDLVFADPPFNIGYLYHGYNDERNDKEYLDFSRDWMK